ncbi:hypothetical protein WJX84_003744 [Apatococcus fuscideae]|uniref:DUF3445 domain-containing protein n=1 Tax=Apatococcus fuscideae TaxID=2026836 RepID=A0AAW1SQ97_9CHLO
MFAMNLQIGQLSQKLHSQYHRQPDAARKLQPVVARATQTKPRADPVPDRDEGAPLSEYAAKPVVVVDRNTAARAAKSQLPVNSPEYSAFAKPEYNPYKMSMGLEPLQFEDWIEVDEGYREELVLRNKLLDEQRDVVYASLPIPEADAANKEMLQLLADFLPGRFPQLFRRVGSQLTNLVTDMTWDLDDPELDHLDVCGRLVQEDLCLMAEVEGELRFVSGVVCFPQRWTIGEKVGMNMERIHEPVPRFNQQLGRSVGGFMNRLAPRKPFWRINWAVSDNPDLFQPVAEDLIIQTNGGLVWNGEGITVENAGERLFTRSERETLSRFSETGAILFSIRTYIRPLQTFRQRPNDAARLSQAIRNLPEDIKRYKTMTSTYEPAVEYLDGIVSAAAASC